MDYMTSKELANALKVNIKTIDRWRVEGLPFIKIGKTVRFEKQAVYEWISEHKQGRVSK